MACADTLQKCGGGELTAAALERLAGGLPDRRHVRPVQYTLTRTARPTGWRASATVRPPIPAPAMRMGRPPPVECVRDPWVCAVKGFRYARPRADTCRSRLLGTRAYEVLSPNNRTDDGTNCRLWVSTEDQRYRSRRIVA